jgi:aryl carrier-like protein
MKIYAPVKDANGIWATVQFINGVGETDNPELIEWFKRQGYTVEESTVETVQFSQEPKNDEVEIINDEINDIKNNEPDFDSMTAIELREWMRANGYAAKMKNTRDKEKLLKILRG